MQKEAKVPRNWYVKCTPGGMFIDVVIAMEVAAEALGFTPSCVVLAVGTNDAGRHMVIQRAEKHFRLLSATATSLFPTAKVRQLNDSISFHAIHALSGFSWGNACCKYHVVHSVYVSDKVM